MTKRTAGHHSGGGKRGNNYWKFASNPSTAIKKKKLIDNYYFYVGSTKHTTNYEMTADSIINHTKKTFDRGNNIAKLLWKLQVQDMTKWEPTLQTLDSANIII
jgi:hypothetical protein